MPENTLAPAGSFNLPAELTEHRYDIKKSAFICQLHPVTDRVEATAALDAARQQYPDARHHCWAFILGDPRQPIAQAFNDDGEPAGTAGKPIMNVLQHRQLGNTMAIVVRYFGGIKLGAGGLVRAYSQATQQAIEAANLTRFIPQRELALDCPYQEEPVLRRFLDQHQGRIVQQHYGERAEFLVALPVAHMDAFTAWLAQHFQIHCQLD